VIAFVRVQEVVSAIRSFRSERAISPKVRIRPSATSDDPADREALRRDGALISRLAGLHELVVSQSLDGTPGARLIAGSVEIAVPMEGLIDTQAETDRLGKLIDKVQKEIAKIETKLGNKGFTDRAPAAVVAEQYRRLEEEKATLAKLQAQLALLGS
jgi:valyl-tRNA synthetase